MVLVSEDSRRRRPQSSMPRTLPVRLVEWVWAVMVFWFRKSRAFQRSGKEGIVGSLMNAE